MRNSVFAKTAVSALISSTLVFSSVLPASAREAASGLASGKRTVDIACVQKAIDAREDALMNAWTAHNTAVSSAYAARKTALHAAWGMTDPGARKAAIKAAWEAFRTSMKTAKETWKKSRKAAWETFRASAHACNATDLGAEQPGSEE